MENNQYNQNDNEKRPSRKVNGILTKAIIVSLFVSMIVGSSFGFLSSLLINGELGRATKQEFLSKDFLEQLRNGIDQDSSAPVPMSSDEQTVVNVAKESQPAVVSIIISKNVPVRGSNDLFEFFGLGPQSSPSLEKREIGGGSGFIVSEDGLIATNRHVVEDTSADYTVLTNDERKYSARVLGRDPVNDIAIIKINPRDPSEGEGTEKLPFLSTGDSNELQIGQSVIAIGNSLGEFRNTVSRGIVSGLKRSIVAGDPFGQSESLSALIQTDAAINQGNSGGPLLNLKGEVVGMNVAIAEGAQNIGFALPINAVKNAIESVKTSGRIVTPYIGIRYVINNAVYAERNGLPYSYGALIMRGQTANDPAILPGSPADQAGLRENDLILEIDGKKITEDHTPANAISEKKPGDTITFKVWSKGSLNDVSLTLTERGIPTTVR